MNIKYKNKYLKYKKKYLDLKQMGGTGFQPTADTCTNYLAMTKAPDRFAGYKSNPERDKYNKCKKMETKQKQIEDCNTRFKKVIEEMKTNKYSINELYKYMNIPRQLLKNEKCFEENEFESVRKTIMRDYFNNLLESLLDAYKNDKKIVSKPGFKRYYKPKSQRWLYLHSVNDKGKKMTEKNFLKIKGDYMEEIEKFSINKNEYNNYVNQLNDRIKSIKIEKKKIYDSKKKQLDEIIKKYEDLLTEFFIQKKTNLTEEDFKKTKEQYQTQLKQDSLKGPYKIEDLITQFENAETNLIEQAEKLKATQ